MKSAEFLTKTTSEKEIFTYEDFTHEQVMMYEATKDFINKTIIPNIESIEKQEGTIVSDILKQAGELGLLGVTVPESLGGLSMDFNTSMLIADIIGISGSFGTTYGAHTGIGTLPILYYGNKVQKEKYIPKLATGELVGCYCLTEPGAGSDANAGKTSAKRSNDKKSFIINGQKIWISNGGFADIMIVFAKIGKDKNHSAFIVESKTKGITMGPEEVKLGIKGSSTRQIFYENVEVPSENLLGKRGQGFEIALNILNIGRIKLCASAIGGAKQLITQSKEYAEDRKQFGTEIRNFGAIREKVALMMSKTFVSESLMYRAGQDIESRGASVGTVKATSEYAIECAIAKVHGSEVLDYVVDESLQIHGGMGYSAEFPIERAYRDSRIARIYEGTNEINRLMLVGQFLKKIKNKELSINKNVIKAYSKIITPSQLTCCSGISLIENHKILLGFLVAKVYKKFGKNLFNHQQVVMWIADIIIEIYANESGFLRSKKTGYLSQKEMSKLYLYESNQLINKVATKIVDSSTSGVGRFFAKKIVNKLTNQSHENREDLTIKMY
tara:strand:- start:119 stop:1786 length:1668 start_codon:yes stop_codon:yes gene_type:complete